MCMQCNAIERNEITRKQKTKTFGQEDPSSRYRGEDVRSICGVLQLFVAQDGKLSKGPDDGGSSSVPAFLLASPVASRKTSIGKPRDDQSRGQHAIMFAGQVVDLHRFFVL